MISLLISLGFEISWGKIEGPSQRITFLGIEIDSRDCSFNLGYKKLAKIELALEQFKEKTRANKKQLQALAGLLNWACQAIKGGRFFLRRILDCIIKLRKPSHKYKLTKEFYKDVDWWLMFIRQFNGVVYYEPRERVNIMTDACNTGGGAFLRGDWYYWDWEESEHEKIKHLHINYKEAVTIVLAIKKWSYQLKDCEVIVLTDNVTAKSVINKGTCKNVFMMEQLRSLFWLCVHNNLKLHAIHIAGVINIIPDSISRLRERGEHLQLTSLLRNWHRIPIGVDYQLNWKHHMSYESLQMMPQVMVEYAVN